MNRRGFLGRALKGLAVAPVVALGLASARPDDVQEPEVFIGHNVVETKTYAQSTTWTTGGPGSVFVSYNGIDYAPTATSTASA
jgi:hypothetical protein